MKFGFRTPSFKKSFKARTTGAAKRAVKRALIPGYGKKGRGWFSNPRKAAYNAVYSRTTVGMRDILSEHPKKQTREQEVRDPNAEYAANLLKQAKESANILNKTVNPDTYFSRLPFLLERLKELADFDLLGTVSFSGDSPQKVYQDMAPGGAMREASIRSFIDRYADHVHDAILALKTPKARQHHVDEFRRQWKQHAAELSNENSNYWNHKAYDLESLMK